MNSKLAALVKSRIGQEFDGECLLAESEALEVVAALSKEVQASEAVGEASEEALRSGANLLLLAEVIRDKRFGAILTDVAADQLEEADALLQRLSAATPKPLPATNREAITEAMVEAAARKLCRLDGYDPDVGKLFGPKVKTWEAYAKTAEAALTAALSVPAPGTGEAVKALKELVDLVAEETMGESTKDDADEDSVGWTEAGPLPMTFGHVRRAQKAIAALAPSTPVGEGKQP